MHLFSHLDPEKIVQHRPVESLDESVGVWMLYMVIGLSRPGELHPQPLAEPDVNVSAHPAPIIQPFGIYPAFQCTNASGIALAIRSRAFIALLVRRNSG